MAISLRASLLALLLAGSLLPLAGLMWIEYQGLAQEREEQIDAAHRASALAAALRADAAGDEDPLVAASRDAPPGHEVLLVSRDGTYRAASAPGRWPELVGAAGETLGGSARLPDPRTGAEVEAAWARAPAHDALVVLVRPPAAPAAALGAPFLLLAAFLSLGLVLLLWFVAHGVLGPLRRLERASLRLARGEWAQRVPVEGPTEVRALAQAFNAMAQELERQRAALDERLEERTRDLIDREGDLEALRFTLAHEFREPLRSLRWLADDLLERPLDPSAREAAGVLRRRIDDLDAVFRDLLRYEDVSRRPFRPETLGLRELLASAHREAATRAPLRLDANGGEALELRGDRDLLVLALGEVLSNVAQHARPRGGGAPRARVLVEDHAEEALVHVDDEGPGIPPARREDAMHLFQRLRRDAPGTGAGLALARRALERHDGALEIGDAPGGGARVTLRLPKAGPAERTPLPEEPRRRRF